ncbi:hypothetical protein [Marinicrinis sediminis]|uniref:Uncharacterized protein n=1 Tax=Marinicrinis sediminis TaxID=1652465 RepID=A0ABW5RFE1_9BACL
MLIYIPTKIRKQLGLGFGDLLQLKKDENHALYFERNENGNKLSKLGQIHLSEKIVQEHQLRNGKIELVPREDRIYLEVNPSLRGRSSSMRSQSGNQLQVIYDRAQRMTGKELQEELLTIYNRLQEELTYDTNLWVQEHQPYSSEVPLTPAQEEPAPQRKYKVCIVDEDGNKEVFTHESSQDFYRAREEIQDANMDKSIEYIIPISS